MSTIATQISLVRYSGPIFDQQQQGSCVANAICGLITLQAEEYHQYIAPLSRQQLYNDSREQVGQFNTDAGSYPSVAFNIAVTKGIANESSFTYGTHNLYVHPSTQVYTEAATQKVLSFETLNIYQNYSNTAKTISEQLMHGKGVLVTTVNQKLADGYVINGGHMVIIVGADDATQTYTFQNSWGTGWGSGGYGKIKYQDLWCSGDVKNGLQRLDIINGWDGVDLTWTAERETVAMLYAGILDRCGENAGVTWWASKLGVTMSDIDIAKAFYQSPEGQALYGAMTDAQYVDQMYYNAIGRRPDQGSINLFVDQLQDGLSRGHLAYNLLHWVDIGRDTQAANDRLENLETVSMNYAITMQVDGTHYNVAVHALNNVTDNANTVPTALVGIQTELGWA